MDYITIHINKKFLIVVSILTAVYFSGAGLYKHGFNKGARGMWEFLRSQQTLSDAESRSDEHTHQGSGIRF